MHHHVVNERPIRREHGRILRLPHRQLRGVVHAQLLHRGQRSRPAKLNVSHVRYVEESGTSAHGHVLGDQAAVLDRHLPSAEVDHLCAKRAMRGVERGLAQRRSWIGVAAHGSPL